LKDLHFMKLHRTAQAAIVVAVLASASTWAFAQNIALVNGKAIPVSRLTAAKAQLAKGGQQVPPEMEGKIKEQLVLREIFAQEAERRGMAASPEYRDQMEFARQSILIQSLFADFEKKNAATEAEAKAEYDKLKAVAPEKEYRARHILVDKEEEAKAIVDKLKGGAKFEDLAKASSKDPGSAENGGDLDWAAPNNYVPEFSEAMVKLEKGQYTQTPVKSQFGFHIIQLDDVRSSQGVPPFAEVKDQLLQRVNQVKMTKYRDEIRKKTKTDFKFSEE
jgi:peptidyl-prolyl cis-trans isomerase C